ncbi:sugar phosphate isomerase/epimerase family protein [Seonamhaeicola sp.]|uniref:sugar phosphate isomerase/epimerase family protein n=1 Tax=Seonamhaeicola sp. TaxID=1912245 RepID=UPI00260AE1D7|nr:sugar phosphate isomerase/epimerase family protein [Seonamhaeicola sp.]
MKIGMNMLLWTDYVTLDQVSIFETLKDSGFDGVEIPIGEGTETHYKAIGNQLAQLQLGVTCVTSLTAQANIASLNPEVRQKGLDRLKWAIDRAYALNAEVLCGPIHSAFAHFEGRPPLEEEKKWSAEMLYLAGDYAQKAKVILAPEALNRFECYLINTASDLKQLLATINHPFVGGIYDTHHGNIEEKSHADAITLLGKDLKHVHISGSDRGTPGKGQIDWDDVFLGLKKVNYQGWLTIEAFSTVIPRFANAINVWRNYSPTEEIYKEGLKLIRSKWNDIK